MFRFFSSNQKTQFSYDFGVCPLMKLVNGKYKALCGVTKCYAARLLNVRKNLAVKLNDLKNRTQLIKYELKLLNALASADPKFLLRAFSFGDFMPEHEAEFRQIVDGFEGRHIAISKTLWINNKVELIKHVGSRIELSLGFTKQLYPKFKGWYQVNKNLPFSLAFTYNSLDEFEWLKKHDPELFNEVDVFHDALVHSRISQIGKIGKTKRHQAILDGFRKNHEEHINSVMAIDENASKKLCNIYGDVTQKRSCADCNGCAMRIRFAA